jgi:cytochrome P450 family 4
MLIYGMHHNPDVFEDPEAFRPERFLPENGFQRHRYSFIPFSSGPRNCIGQKFAMLEIKVVLSTLMRHFRFTCPFNVNKLQTPRLSMVLDSASGVRIIAYKKSSQAFRNQPGWPSG